MESHPDPDYDPSDETETALSFTQGCEEAFRAELATEGVRVVEP